MFADLVKQERTKLKEEGKIEGKIETISNVVENMYENGLNLDLISNISQLSINKVKEILKLN